MRFFGRSLSLLDSSVATLAAAFDTHRRGRRTPRWRTLTGVLTEEIPLSSQGKDQIHADRLHSEVLASQEMQEVEEQIAANRTFAKRWQLQRRQKSLDWTAIKNLNCRTSCRSTLITLQQAKRTEAVRGAQGQQSRRKADANESGGPALDVASPYYTRVGD